MKRIKTVALELDPVLVGEADARLAEIQARQEVIIERRGIRVVEPDGYGNVWQQACIKPDLPAMSPIFVCLATRENEAGSELMVDGEHICGWIALYRATEIGDLLLRLRDDFRVKLTEDPVGFEIAVVAIRRETHGLVCTDQAAESVHVHGA